mmetsp:Transcript_14788/g.18284  ORF Transcript_14788/g.18284 Transcript_14788/m.18284 type:complete len:164 (+) Transcript_14788:3-494(+)
MPLGRDFENPPWMRVITDDYSKSLNTALLNGGVAGKPSWHKMLRKKAKKCLTGYEVIGKETFGDPCKLEVTRLKLSPITGRSHQLRVHCAALGHPIVGDDIYGYDGRAACYGGVGKQVNSRMEKNIQAFVRANKVGLKLHAKTLLVTHPKTKEILQFEAPVPF